MKKYQSIYIKEYTIIQTAKNIHVASSDYSSAEEQTKSYCFSEEADGTVTIFIPCRIIS